MKRQILIDTQIFLWLFLAPERFTEAAIKFVRNRSDNDFFVSHVSAWEISIKFGTGRIKLPKPPEQFVPQRMQRARFKYLPLELDHVLRVHSLPMIHRDPFDRLIISQAALENLTILTTERMFTKYGVEVLRFTDIC